MAKHSSTLIGHELSRFLVAYLLTLVSVLVLVHVLQPAREATVSPSRSPVHQERQRTARHSATTPGERGRTSADPGPASAPRDAGEAATTLLGR
jgi:hypothetical protein